MFISRDGSIFKTYLSTSKNIIAKKNFEMFTYSREAIFEICNQNNISTDDEVLLPDYLCSTVIESILPFTKNIKFYSIDENMNFDSKEIRTLISDTTKLIFFVDYFGIETHVDKELEIFLKNKNIIIVKDAAHSFLSLVHHDFKKEYNYDYLISSIYKNLPFQVGSIAIGKFDRKNRFINFSVFVKRTFVLLIKNILSLLGQNKYINKDIEKMVITDNQYINYNYGMNLCGIYYFLLKHINFDRIIIEKQKLAKEYNEIFLENRVYKSLFSKTLIESNVLQAYPIKCDNKEQRDSLLALLKEESIDAYTWPTFHKMNSNDRLWNRILLLPIDKKVLKIMKRIADV
ncbi:MAG: DegT/DnrJ/EryC1/StrS family aminotransferase [Sulfurimonas sp.]|nr:DegT/DnrJ/EryC1/StrS family aminotransferase [Sulfurimonas sp.]